MNHLKNILFLLNPFDKENNDILVRYLDDYFPEDIAVDKFILNSVHGKNSYKPQDYSPKHLPLHTRDNAWLMIHVCKVLKKRLGENYDISSKRIKDFVYNNPQFKNRRDKYEQRVIAAHARQMLNQPFLSLCMEKESFPNFNRYSASFDQLFREDVIANMVKKGFDAHRVELSLEKHAHLWRKQAMIIAFENQYYPLASIIEMNEQFDDWWHRLARFKQKHQEEWLKLQEYYYYFDHKSIINEARSKTPNMNMNITQLTMVKSKLARMEKRLQRILASKPKLSFIQPKGLKQSKTQNTETQHTI